MIHLNYSQLRDFTKCGRLYQKKHLDGRADEEDPKRAFIGHVLGRLVEQFYVQRWWIAADTLDWTMTQAARKLEREVTDAESIIWQAGELAEWQTKIDAALPVIVATIKAEKLLSKAVHLEYETTLDYTDIVPTDTVRIHGRPDIIIERGEVLTVLDAKAGGTVGKFTDRNQLRQYALAVWKKFGRLPTRVGFWWLRHGKIVWMKISEQSLTKFEGVLKETARKALSGPYLPEPSAWCRGCAFRMDCPEGRAYGMTKGSKVVIAVEANVGTVSL